jgi:hypothetical protein
MVLHRIAALPRRDWPELVEETQGPLSAALRCEGAEGLLRPIQAVGLREALECGGAFIMADVGVGKTLVSLLVGELMGEERVLILVPSGVKGKTEDEFIEYRKTWNGVRGERYKLFGYHDISRFPKEGFSIQRLWNGLGPTMIVCDEADKLRRVDVSSGASGLALQINDYLQANPECKLIALTATPDKSGVKDYAHILNWCLRAGSPLPDNPEDIADWSAVIDKGDMHAARKVCIQMGIPPTYDLDTIRAGYHARLKQTKGVLISDEGFDGPLDFECDLVEPPPMMVPHFHRARKLNQRPDGWDLSPDGPVDEEDERRPDRITEGGVWACERQLALGFCYVADPVPPDAWMDARRQWFKAIRYYLKRRAYYTALQVDQAAARGELKKVHQKAYEHWETIKPSFTPGSKALWLSDHMLNWCAAWGRQPGIIWVDHIAFGLELEKLTGFRYFQGGGKDRHGKSIEKASNRETIIASRSANSTGRNLQNAPHDWHRNLVTAMPANNRDFQQMVGRTHRSGQKHPVHVDVLIGCKAHFESLAKVLDDATRQSSSIMQQKAHVFPWTFPPALPDGVVFND